MSRENSGRWLLGLFGVPFAGVGIGVLVMAVIPTLHDAWRMQAWVSVPAQVVSAELVTRQGDDSDTWQAVAHYRYRVAGTEYDGHRVAINDGGADNLGDFQRERARELVSAWQSGSPIPVWVNPEDPSESVYHRGIRKGLLGMYGLFALVFGGAGVAMIVRAVRHRGGGTGVVSADRPWLTRTAWASPTLVARQGGKTRLLWFGAVFWCALSAPANFAIPQELARGNYPILIILLFDLVGIGLVVAAIRQTLAARRFGDTPLQMDPHPGAIGGEVGGYFDARVPYRADQVFTVGLSCVRTWVTGSGKNRSTHRDVRWQDGRSLYAEPAGDGESRVWFAFSPPAELPVSQTPSDDYVSWHLRVDCALPGVDFSREWEVPVFATAAAGSGTPRRRMRAAVAEEAAAVEAAVGFTQTAGGAAMDFRAGRHWRWALVMILVFGGMFGGAGAGMALVGDDLMVRWVMAPVFLCIGLLCVTTGLWMIGNRLRVEATGEGLQIRRWLFGVPVMNRLIVRDEIEGIGYVRGSTASVGGRTTQYYDLAVCLNDGRRHGIGDSLAGVAQARQAAGAFATYARLRALDELPGQRRLGGTNTGGGH